MRKPMRTVLGTCRRHADVGGDEAKQEGVSFFIFGLYSNLFSRFHKPEEISEAPAPGKAFTFVTSSHLHCLPSLTRSVDLLCSVKYKNNLPDVPFGPKFLSYPFDSQR